MVVGGGEDAAPNGRDVEHAEEVAADEEAADWQQVAGQPHAEVVRPPGQNSGEGILRIAQALPLRVGQRGIRRRVAASLALSVGELNHDQEPRLGDGKGSQAHGVQQLEDGGVGTDSQGQRQDSDGRESRILAQRADAVAKVGEQGSHIEARAAPEDPTHFNGVDSGRLSGFANVVCGAGCWPTKVRSSVFRVAAAGNIPDFDFDQRGTVPCGY